MGTFLSSITLIIFISLSSPQPSKTKSQEIKSAPLLDLVIRDYAFRSYNKKNHFRTGKLHTVDLPSNLSGITVHTIRFRCGSLHRYGAKFKEFQLGPGVLIRPCTKRVMLIRQELGSNWSSLYYDNYYGLTGYRLISPVLGLMAYNLGPGQNRSKLEIRSSKKPITVDFTSTALTINATSASGIIPLCASFDQDGRVALSNQVRPNVCVAAGHGHFGLVVESPVVPLVRRRMSRWRMAVGSSIGAAVGAFLLSLLVIAVFVSAKKKKARMDEMERRAYEEEALQVSMVGHVRAVTASGTRTVPTIEHDEDSPPTR